MSPEEGIKIYYSVWDEYHTRFVRSEGLDSNINASWGIVEKTMNELLEDYFAQLVKVNMVASDG